MQRVRVLGEWFPEDVFSQVVEAVREIDPVFAFCIEGGAEYEED